MLDVLQVLASCFRYDKEFFLGHHFFVGLACPCSGLRKFQSAWNLGQLCTLLWKNQDEFQGTKDSKFPADAFSYAI